jgi:hypothetical protein
MPKKTKKQKLQAEKRRHSITHSPEVTPPTFSLHLKEEQQRKIDKTNNEEELQVIKKDLTKTIILAVIAIGIELGVHSMLRGT